MGTFLFELSAAKWLAFSPSLSILRVFFQMYLCNLLPLNLFLLVEEANFSRSKELFQVHQMCKAVAKTSLHASIKESTITHHDNDSPRSGWDLTAASFRYPQVRSEHYGTEFLPVFLSDA